MDYKTLGTFEVLRDDEPVDLGSHKQQMLLVLLLINANEVVSVDRILEEIWGDDAVGKKSVLQVYVSRLRSALEPQRSRGDASVLETKDPGYLLRVDPESVDAFGFEHRIEQARDLLAGDPGAAAEQLSDALAMWSGAAFEQFEFDDFCRLEKSRLDELRVAAQELNIDAELAVGRSGELVSELEILQQRHPLRERFVTQLMLALYRSGRAADALRLAERFRRHLGEELGIDPSPALLRLEEQVLLHDDAIQMSRKDAKLMAVAGSRTATNPYMGLQSFGVDDAASFFGRDALVAEMLRVIGHGQSLVSVIGASGSGKSSVVRAGLIPALAKGALPNSESWLVASMVPGSYPFAELEAALLRSTINGPDSLSEQLADPQAGVLRSILRVLPEENSRLVLIIDQFEELFTLVDDDDVRNRFLDNLVNAIDDPHERVSIVITLRADFYGQPLRHPAFGARLGDSIINVTQLTAEELEAAAVGPAQQARVAFEPALLAQLMSDVGTQPGGLPLFQFALTELFDRRSGESLSLSSYRAMGGLEGALQRRVDDLYVGLDDDEKETARQLFLRLVTISDDGQPSRRRAAVREIVSLGIDTVVLQRVVGLFGDRRLLSFDADKLTGAPTIEVAHEALLQSWPTLAGWVEDSREDLRRHASLLLAMREWQIADENPHYLLSAARVDEFTAWTGMSRLELNEGEAAYLTASAQRIEAEHAALEARLNEDARSRRRLLGLIAALAASLGVAALFLFGAFEAEPQVVTFFGNSNDNGWHLNIAQGLEKAERDLDLVVEAVPWAIDLGAEFRELAEEGPEIVISDGMGLAEDPAVLEDFPSVQFGFVDSEIRGSNSTYVLYANEQGAYLAGVAAALKTETGVVGFIGGAQIPTIEEFRAGFETGVRSVDPDVRVLSTFVDQQGSVNGFTRPDIGKERALALYRRDADVVFAAAGFSGFGLFPAAVEESEATGRYLWAIGVDNDQWFDVAAAEQPHVLTSIIKRGDIGSYQLAEHMLNGGRTGNAGTIGLAEGGFDFSTQGDGLDADMVERLEQAKIDVADGRIVVPENPVGDVLFVDVDGNEVDQSEAAGVDDGTEANSEPGFDGLAQFAAIAPGRYDLESLGTPVTLTIEGDWWLQLNMAGHTMFSHPDSQRPDDRGIHIFRPNVLADPAKLDVGVDDPRMGDVEFWPMDDIEGWLASVPDGIVMRGPEQQIVGGRSATYFEVEVTDAELCGVRNFCLGFLINSMQDGWVSGWSFEHGFRSRVWWVDGGDLRPLVIIAATKSSDLQSQAVADTLLDTLVIGEAQPHPEPVEWYDES